MTEINGYFTFVLHSHLPYVISHGRWPHGTDWLNEAAVECYIPLLTVLNSLVNEGHKPNIAVGITPILMEQLSSELFKAEIKDYLNAKIEASKADIAEFARFGNGGRVRVAQMWLDFFSNALTDLRDKYDWNIIKGFVELQENGAIEIITCAATHGYLPLLGKDECVNAQIRLGKHVYRKHCRKDPQGIWLPECAYRPSYTWKTPVESDIPEMHRKGIEEFLYENEIKYFIVDGHLLDGSEPIGAYLERFEGLKRLWQQSRIDNKPLQLDTRRTPHDVYCVSSTGGKKTVAIFVRDPETGVQVWSGEHGYPGDGNYLDFHKKHFPGGNRYWRVTAAKSDMADKEEYDPEMIDGRLRENASHFCALIRDSLAREFRESGKPAVLIAPFDAELFGHWWFEGPKWLYHVLRELDKDKRVALRTCTEILADHPAEKALSIPEGSWGEGGFHWIWLNDHTKWTWKHIYEAEHDFVDFVHENIEKLRGDGDAARVAKQAARELLLLESSDWQFLISTWSARDYAELRVAAHYEAFKRLLEVAKALVDKGEVDDGEWLYVIDREERTDCFKEIDLGWWSASEESNKRTNNVV
jgi:1,4-alpha-glucan branching enzyme